MLTTWRRHGPTCNQDGRNAKRCSCVWWIEGTTSTGRKIKRQSLRTRLAPDAERKKQELYQGAAVLGKKLSDAKKAFTKDVERRNVSKNLQQKWKRLFELLKEYGEEKGLQRMPPWGYADATEFVGEKLDHLAAATLSPR